MKKLFVFVIASLLTFSACGKKADKALDEKSPESIPVQEEKSDKAPDTKAPEEVKSTPEQAQANEEKKPEAVTEPENPPKLDDNHTDLALDKDCVVTHCKNYNGTGHYWLECDTENIVEAGFAFGDDVSAINYKNGKPVYRVHIQGRGDNCVEQGHYADKCFVNQKKYIEYIIENQLICNYEDDATTCIYDDDEHKKCRSKKLYCQLSL